MKLWRFLKLTVFPIYDSAYVALGKVLGDKVYTADEKLLRKVKELPFVLHIRDFKIPEKS